MLVIASHVRAADAWTIRRAATPQTLGDVAGAPQRQGVRFEGGIIPRPDRYGPAMRMRGRGTVVQKASLPDKFRIIKYYSSSCRPRHT
jgi:hypothetical protein